MPPHSRPEREYAVTETEFLAIDRCPVHLAPAHCNHLTHRPFRNDPCATLRFEAHQARTRHMMFDVAGGEGGNTHRREKKVYGTAAPSRLKTAERRDSYAQTLDVNANSLRCFTQCHVLLCDGIWSLHEMNARIPPFMRYKVLLSAEFIVHAIFGNFCMMMPATLSLASGVPVAHAMESATHAMYGEMAITPITPMSSAHCIDCVTEEVTEQHAPPMTSSCTGHCLASAEDTATPMLSFFVTHIAAPTLHLIAWMQSPSITKVHNVIPIPSFSTTTIVLRL